MNPYLPEKPRWQTAFLTTLCILLVAVVCVGMNGGISIGASNHVGLLPVVRRILDPHYLPGDFNIGLRLYHHRIFACLLAGLVKLLGESRALIVLHITGIAFLTTSLFYLCRTLKLSYLAFVGVGLMLGTGFLWTGFGLEENTFLGNPEIQPPLFAHAFALLVIAMLMQQRFRWAAFLAGCAVLFHLQIGVIVTLMIGPFYLWRWRVFGLKELAALAGCYLLPAVPALWHLLGMLQRGLLQPNPPTAERVYSLASYIDFRHPHHFALFSPQHAWWIAAHGCLLLACWWWVRRRQISDKKSFDVLLGCSGMLVLLSLAHFTDYYLIRQDKFANLQTIRVSPFISLFGAITLVWWGNTLMQPAASKVIFNLLLIVAAVTWGYRIAHLPESETHFGIRYYADLGDKRGNRQQWVDICNWIRANGARDTAYLTPPANDGFTALTHRSNVVEFKINPDGALQLNEWYARLHDLTGGKLPTEKGLDNRSPLNKAYGELSAEQFIALGHKYHAAFAVVPKNAKLPFATLYQNDRLKLVVLAQP